MDRRRYLAAVAATGLAGCGRLAGSDSSTGRTGGDGDEGTATGTVAGPGADDLPVPEAALVRGAGKDAIPAITEPAFADDWSDYTQDVRRLGELTHVNPELNDDDRVVGVAREGEARAYPLRILNFHEVVNDEFAGPLLVTYCPLCGSGITAERRVDGAETTFGVSGWLWNSDLVLYDEATESLWSQILATAIRGPETGEMLALVPSTITTWAEWQSVHPDTTVLVPPPESNTVSGPTAVADYATNPYTAYQGSGQIGVGENDFSDDRLFAKAEVLGIAHGGVARAYPFEVVTRERVINDVVGGLPVVVAATPFNALVAYERIVEGERLTFERADDRAFVRAGGSRWHVATGEAVGGPHEGVTLAPATDRTSMFWFAWADFYPETEVYDP